MQKGGKRMSNESSGLERAIDRNAEKEIERSKKNKIIEQKACIQWT